MLSSSNIEKLNMRGLYSCKPDVKYRGKLYENDIYHCCNWTFHVVKDREGNYYMRDTYWNSGDSMRIPLTDKNINKFELLFDRDKVKSIKRDEIHHYKKTYTVAIDSGGRRYPKHFVDKGGTKDKGLILEEIDDKIKSLEKEVSHLKSTKQKIEDGSFKLDWY